MKNIAYILELIWLALAIFCLATGVWATLKTGFSISYVFFIFSVVAFLMYLLRRSKRKKLENQN